MSGVNIKAPVMTFRTHSTDVKVFEKETLAMIREGWRPMSIEPLRGGGVRVFYIIDWLQDAAVLPPATKTPKPKKEHSVQNTTINQDKLKKTK